LEVADEGFVPGVPFIVIDQAAAVKAKEHSTVVDEGLRERSESDGFLRLEIRNIIDSTEPERRNIRMACD